MLSQVQNKAEQTGSVPSSAKETFVAPGESWGLNAPGVLSHCMSH